LQENIVASMAEAPSFVFLSQKLPAHELATTLIGRGVENIKLPITGYRPKSNVELELTDDVIEVTDTNASIYVETHKDTTAKGRLGQLFELSAELTSEEKATLEGKTVILDYYRSTETFSS
jgi:hypothetical protein